MKTTVLLAAALGALIGAPSASAFGTIRGGGMQAEHEQITRLGLGCSDHGPCLDPRTLTMVAGDWSAGHAIFGAVGSADRSTSFLRSEPHCDNGDHLDGDYPGLNREGLAPGDALVACRDFAARKLDEAVRDAGGLVDSRGRLRRFQSSTNCSFWFGIPGRAKCNALEAFGFVLHTSQDFYSHTNWVDRPVEAPPFDRPPGLNNDGPAAWISLRAGAPVDRPAGLISGCYSLVPPEARGCSYVAADGSRLRVTHDALNKDRGYISATAISRAGTPRGKDRDNFERAVRAAIADTRDKWRLFEERLVERYGPERGRLMACALRSDDPRRTCAGLMSG